MRTLVACASVALMALCLVALMAVTTEGATIELDNSDFVVENSANSASLGFTLGANPDRTLVVTVGGERNDSISSLAFDGTPLTEAALFHTGQTHASVWYLDLDDTGTPISGDVELAWSGSNNGFYIGAFSLYNVAPGGPVATDSGGNDSANDITLSYGTAAAGDMIVESAAAQGSGSIVAPAALTVLYNQTESGGGGYAAAAGHQPITVGGSVSNTWQFQNIGSPPRVRAAGARFAAVPEPSALALFGAGLLAFALFRRRRTRP